MCRTCEKYTNGFSVFKMIIEHLRMFHPREFPGIQWLGLRAFTAGGMGSIPGQELRSRMPRGMVKKKKFHPSDLIQGYGSGFH